MLNYQRVIVILIIVIVKLITRSHILRIVILIIVVILRIVVRPIITKGSSRGATLSFTLRSKEEGGQPGYLIHQEIAVHFSTPPPKPSDAP